MPICPLCNGTKYDFKKDKNSGYFVECKKCHGTGIVEEQTNEEWFANLSTEEKATYIFWKMIGFDMYDDNRVSAIATSAMKEVVDNGGSRGQQCYAGIKAIENWLKEVHKE